LGRPTIWVQMSHQTKLHTIRVIWTRLLFVLDG
jgi:hypothetical protein